MKTYELITNKIIEELEKGVIPWLKGYTEKQPMNLISKKSYHGINHLMLTCFSEGKSQYWLTFKQAKQLDGHVNAGAKGIPVVYCQTTSPEEITTEKKEYNFFMRHYFVFNMDDCTLPAEKIPAQEINPIQVNITAEEILSKFIRKPAIEHGSGTPFYSPTFDKVGMPDIESYQDTNQYYSTLFHELVHSTGHKDRLDRFKENTPSRFGSEDYSKEELTAEIGSCYLNSMAGIDNIFKNNVAYIQSWLKALKNDKNMIISAASKAEKATNYILNREVV